MVHLIRGHGNGRLARKGVACSELSSKKTCREMNDRLDFHARGAWTSNDETCIGDSHVSSGANTSVMSDESAKLKSKYRSGTVTGDLAVSAVGNIQCSAGEKTRNKHLILSWHLFA